MTLWGTTTGVRANSGQVETPGLKQSSWFHCKPIAKEDILKDNRVSRWHSHYYPTCEPYCKIEKANGYTAAVSSFVWPLDYFLKWAHQKAMLGENKGHNMMWCSQRNAVYCPRMIGTKKNVIWCPTKAPWICYWPRKGIANILHRYVGFFGGFLNQFYTIIVLWTNINCMLVGFVLHVST